MHLVFLPGAGGAAEFWHPLGGLLPPAWDKTYLSWPGLGDQAHDPQINDFDGLVELTARKIPGAAVIVAQSMGGIVAVRLALKYPEKITRLVLVATSGGVDVKGMGGEDWRSSYFASFPKSQTWIATEKPDHTADMPNIACPTLLIWGDDDPISPVAVGRHLSELIGPSRLCVVAGGNHNLGRERAEEIAPLIIDHLG